MFKKDAISFFGNKTKLAAAAGVTRPSVSAWGELVPEGRASRLALASEGALVYDPLIYDQYRNAKRSGGMNNENQA